MDGMCKQEGYDLIGAAMDVYNEMGSGYLEEVYQECLERELTMRGVLFTAQPVLELFYKGVRLKKFYRPDLVVCEQMVVELKAIKSLGNEEAAQILNYLKGSRRRVGCLINFGHPSKLDWRRFAL